MTKYVNYVLTKLKETNIMVTKEEQSKIEIADFGLNNFEEFGLGILTYVNNGLYCAKELVMLPNQICPEHRHPPFNDYLGKVETFRCRAGEVTLHVDSKKRKTEYAEDEIYTCDTVIKLYPGEQYTIQRDTKHWFKAGPDGAVISEFSSPSYDERDIFTNKHIKRVE